MKFRLPSRGYLLCWSWLLLVWCAAAQDGQPGAKEWQILRDAAHQAYQQGRYQAALDTSHRALRAAESFGPKDVRRAITLHQNGIIGAALGRYADAESAYVEAMVILDANPPERYLLAQLLHHLARVYMESGGRYAQAERVMRRALALGLATVGPTHPDVAGLLANLASAEMMLRKDEEAQAHFQQALTILENSPPQYHPEKASILSNLGFLSLWRGDSPGALLYLEKSVALNEAALGSGHPELIPSLLNLARLRLRLQHTAAAQDPARHALAIAEQRLGPAHPMLYQALSTYAGVLRKSRRRSEARKLESRAKAVLAANPEHAAQSTVHVTDLLDLATARMKLVE